MKKMIIVLFSLALIFPISAMAEISVLKGKESNSGYQINAKDVWDKYKDSTKLFLVIDADLETTHFKVGDVVAIFYWTQGKGSKFYLTVNLDAFADVQIADLGKIKRKRKVAFCIEAEFWDDILQAYRSILGHLMGERTKTGIIKHLTGNFLRHTYDDEGGTVINIEKVKWDISRIKDFTGNNAAEIVGKIEMYLESKGYVKIQ